MKGQKEKKEKSKMSIELDEKKIYSFKEMQELFGVCRRTLISYEKDGKLKSRKIGRERFISGINLKRFIENR
jgi:hypothetical protein